jgi:hypothetical protein
MKGETLLRSRVAGDAAKAKGVVSLPAARNRF